jgi:hypothetical protein
MTRHVFALLVGAGVALAGVASTTGANVGVHPQSTPPPRFDVQIVVEVLGRDLRYSERAGGAEERIEIALATVDERGRAANGKNTSIGLQLGPEELQRMRDTGVRWLSQPPHGNRERASRRLLRSRRRAAAARPLRATDCRETGKGCARRTACAVRRRQAAG